MTLHNIEVRPLLPIDSDDLKDIRLEALKRDGRFFAASYKTEEALSAEAWVEKSTETKESCIIGLFHETDLIGISAISKWDGDASGKTALFGSSYIKPTYRGLGLASLLYAARLAWADNNSLYASAVVFHRDGNNVSKGLNTQHGGEYWQQKPMNWGDGQEAVGHWYKIALNGVLSAVVENPRRTSIHKGHQLISGIDYSQPRNSGIFTKRQVVATN